MLTTSERTRLRFLQNLEGVTNTWEEQSHIRLLGMTLLLSSVGLVVLTTVLWLDCVEVTQP